MRIDRNNYEEYFILYMDNELSVSERREVELFVQNHPDLKEELDQLLHYKLVPDTSLVFKNKEDLLMGHNEIPITVSNYPEWLTLYIDNELSATDKNAVERFIREHPELQSEFRIWNQAKLVPEEIIFSGKSALYRTEATVRALPMRRWWMIAAAVALVVVTSVTALVLINRKPADQEIVKTNLPVQSPVTTTVPENKIADNTMSPVVQPPITAEQSKQSIVSRDNNPVKEKINPVIKAPSADKETEVAYRSEKVNNDLPQPLFNPNVNSVASSEAARTIQPESNKETDALAMQPVTNTASPTYDIIPASFIEPDSEAEPSGSKKNKLRGFFRKVTRTFEKRTQINPTDEDNKLLVAGLAFKLK